MAPRMNMYCVVFERLGEVQTRFYSHASSEAEAQAHSDAFFRSHPEHDPRAEKPDLDIRVEIARKSTPA